MTLAEILAQIKRYYPKAATWSDAEIVSILNSEQREIFRDIQIMAAPYEFETVVNQPSYSLPSNCELEFIKYLGLTKDNPITAKSTFTEYTYADLNENLCGYRYHDMNGLIGLYPVPTVTGYKVRILYEKRPVLLSATSPSVVPELKEDWHRIFVYAAIIEIAGAGSNPDVTTVNNYTLKYNELMGKILLAKYNNKPYPKTKNVKNWNR